MSDPVFVYRVRDWDRHFETHETRKLARIRFLLTPNQHDGMGIQRVLHHDHGAAVFGLWNLIIQALSRQRKPRQGWLTEDGRRPGEPGGTPWDVEDLSLRWRRPVDEIQMAVDFLSSPRLGWLERMTIEEARKSPVFMVESPENDQESPEYSPESPGISQKSGGKREVSPRKRDGTGRLKAKSPALIPSSPASVPKPSGGEDRIGLERIGGEGIRAQARADGSAAAPPPPPDWHRMGWDAVRLRLTEAGAEFVEQDRERWEQLVERYPKAVLVFIRRARDAGTKRTARAIGKTLDDQAEEHEQARRARAEQSESQDRQQRIADDEAKAARHQEDLELAKAQGPGLLAEVDRLVAQGVELPGTGAMSVAGRVERFRKGAFSPYDVRQVQDWVNSRPQPAVRPAEPVSTAPPGGRDPEPSPKSSPPDLWGDEDLDQQARELVG